MSRASEQWLKAEGVDVLAAWTAVQLAAKGMLDV